MPELNKEAEEQKSFALTAPEKLRKAKEESGEAKTGVYTIES